MPSILRRDDDVVGRRGRVARLGRVRAPGNRASSGSACPSRCPARRRRVRPPARDRRQSRLPRPPATCTASSTCGSSTVLATEPVWPPPSPPCTTSMSTPSSAIFFACLTAPTVGTQRMPAVAEPRDHLRVRPAPEAHRARPASRSPCRRSAPRRAGTCGSSRRTAGPSASARDRSRDRRRPAFITAAARKPNAPALHDAATSSGRRDPAHRGLDDRIAAAELARRPRCAEGLHAPLSATRGSVAARRADCP